MRNAVVVLLGAMILSAVILTLPINVDGSRPQGQEGGGPGVLQGTWKLNEAKSKFSTGAPKNSTVVYEVAGDTVKVTIDGTGTDGKPIHNEWTGKFDGKDYPVKGDPNAEMRSFKTVDDHTFSVAQKKGDRVTITGRIVVSADRKTRTVTLGGTDAMGNKVSTVTVYDKQQ